MSKIFISYSRRDVDFATRLKDGLEAAGHIVWIDLEGISAGSDWSDTIQVGLDESDVMLVILSPDSMNSKNVGDEFKYFLDEGKPVIPVYWRECKIFFQLRRLQYVDFRGDIDESLAQLLDRLEGRTSTSPHPPSPIPPVSAANQRLWTGLATLALLVVIALIAGAYLLNDGDDESSADAPSETPTETATETASPIASHTPTPTPTFTPNTPSALMAATGTAAPPPTPRPLTAQDAEYVIRASNEGGLDTANVYVCPAEQFTEEDVIEDVAFDEIKCDRQDDTMKCEFRFRIGDASKQFRFEQVFQIRNEKLCETLSLTDLSNEGSGQ